MRNGGLDVSGGIRSGGGDELVDEIGHPKLEKWGGSSRGGSRTAPTGSCASRCGFRLHTGATFILHQYATLLCISMQRSSALVCSTPLHQYPTLGSTSIQYSSPPVCNWPRLSAGKKIVVKLTKKRRAVLTKSPYLFRMSVSRQDGKGRDEGIVYIDVEHL